MALYIAHGTYVGDGADNRDIAVSPSFAIKFVLLKRNGASSAFLSISGMGDAAKDLAANGSGTDANIIQSMGTGTFQVGNRFSDSNANGETYYYLAIGGDSTEIVSGTYTGNGSDGRTITTNFLPEFVIVCPTGAFNPVGRFGGMVGDLSIELNESGGTASNLIESFVATGFTVGNDSRVNGGSNNYAYVAVKAVTGQTSTFSYTGNETDNRDITTPGFQPSAVIIKGNNQNGVFRTASHIGDSCSLFTQASNPSNEIQSFISTGFQVGTGFRVNQSGTYYVYAIKNLLVDPSVNDSVTVAENLSVDRISTFIQPAETKGIKIIG